MKLALKQLMSFGVHSFVPTRAGAASGAQAQGPYLREQVRVRLSPRFSRRAHPEAAVEAAIERTWEQFRADAPQLFNASKFRLQGCRPQQSVLELDWGLTDYKTYLGTCCSTLAPRLLADGAALSENERFAFLSRKVGVAAVLETSDAHVALIKRSKAVGLYQDLYDTPGGHPEPSHIDLTVQALETLELPGHEQQRQALETAARDEFFRSIVNEVYEEVNVAPQQLEPPLLLGVVLQTDACTPSFSFHLKTTCSAEELRELYRVGPADKFESVQLELLRVEDLLVEAGTSALEKLKLTPSAQGTLALWKQHALNTRK